MKSKVLHLISLVGMIGIVLAACTPAATPKPAEPEKKTLKVINLINGVLGDKSFIDSANRGVTKAKEELGLEVKTIEAGTDPAKWQPALEDAAANEEYDILICGTYQMAEFLALIAPKYPDKKFIIYDVSLPYETCEGNQCANVYSVLYKQNEGSYLAGVYAALMSKTGIIGAVGAQDIPVINDFIVGYRQGARENGIPEDKMLVQYASGWNDPAKGKEIALAMYQQGADIVFQIAGGTGEGIFKAAQEAGKWAIGVDSDQYLAIKDTNPEQAKVILTSMMKNVDNSLYRALKMHIEGTLPYGKAEYLGIKEGGVGLAKNDYYNEVTPEEVKAKVDEAEKALLEGRITVETAFK